MKKLLLLLVGVAMSTQMIMAQVPSNVSKNGLVACYPFNGNANDESGNGFNGTVNGATLTSDRFGNLNSAYSFNGNFQHILTNILQSNISAYSVSVWFKTTGVDGGGYIFQGSGSCGQGGYGTRLIVNSPKKSAEGYGVLYGTDGWAYTDISTTDDDFNDGVWHHAVGVWDGTGSSVVNPNQCKVYVDGVLVAQTLGTSVGTGGYGTHPNIPMSGTNKALFGMGKCDAVQHSYNGQLDDISLWNRALTQEEVTNLFYSNVCNQSITVTDALIINTGVLGYNPMTYKNTVTIYPNPANDHIIIDCGNLEYVNGFKIKLFNELGQEVFNGEMNTEQYNVSLANWSKGLYLVKIFDNHDTVVNTKKIILQ